jgi:hypothetical protein
LICHSFQLAFILKPAFGETRQKPNLAIADAVKFQGVRRREGKTVNDDLPEDWRAAMKLAWARALRKLR